MAIVAPQLPSISSGETRFCAVDFSGKLDTGELLTGTPTVVELDPPSPAILTISSKAVNTGALTINGATAAIGEAVQFTVSGTSISKGVVYRILITCGTDASQTVQGEVRLVGA